MIDARWLGQVPYEQAQELMQQTLAARIRGDIPDTLQSYIDYDAIARDLAVDFSETMIAGERLVYACR